jgi:hypothetical protein
MYAREVYIIRISVSKENAAKLGGVPKRRLNAVVE